jgi:hypothetical protein
MLSDQIDSRRFFAAISMASALLTLALVLTAAPPQGAPSDLLAYFRANQGRFVVLAIVVLTWVIVSLLAVVATGRLVAGDRPLLGLAATLASSGGILLLGFGTFIFVGAFFALNAATQGSVEVAQANYQASFWYNMSFLLSDPGLMVLGGGQAILGWLAWRSRAIHRFAGAVGVAGGLAGLLTLAVYQTPFLAIIQLLSLCITNVAAGVALSRIERTDPGK